MYCDKHEGLETHVRCGRLAGHEPPCAPGFKDVIDSRTLISRLRAAYDGQAKEIRNIPAGPDHDMDRALIHVQAENAAVALARDLFHDTEGTLTTDQVIAVASRGSTLRGFSHTGITYHNAPDMFVGEYVPARDDSFAPGWVQPRWVDGEMTEGVGVTIAIDPGAPEGDRGTITLWTQSYREDPDPSGPRLLHTFEHVSPGVVRLADTKVIPPSQAPAPLKLGALLAAPFGDPVSASELLAEADDLIEQSEQIIRDAAVDDFDVCKPEPAFAEWRAAWKGDEAVSAAIIALGEERAAAIYREAWQDGREVADLPDNGPDQDAP
jgi:hypothetical protein